VEGSGTTSTRSIALILAGICVVTILLVMTVFSFGSTGSSGACSQEKAQLRRAVDRYRAKHGPDAAPTMVELVGDGELLQPSALYAARYVGTPPALVLEPVKGAGC
jgi:hypothetical protein